MSVRIYQIDKGFSQWVWLCPSCLEHKKANGWDVKEDRDPPKGQNLPCDDCPGFAVNIPFVLVFALALLGLACKPVDASGDWSYAWQTRTDQTLHGVLSLTQSDDWVSGSIGVPSDYPNPPPGLADAWTWTVSGQLDGDRVLLYAPAPTTPGTLWDDPWWFDVTVFGDVMAGPEYAGAEMYDRNAMFTAERLP